MSNTVYFNKLGISKIYFSNNTEKRHKSIECISSTEDTNTVYLCLNMEKPGKITFF